MASSDDVLARKYVEFAARGLGDVDTYAKNLRDEMNRAKTAADALKKSLADGTYAKIANQLVNLRKKYADMKQAARMTDLIAEHGKVSGTIRYMQERLSSLTTAAGVGFGVLTGTTLAWVHAGMQGTIEAERLNLAWTYLSRSIASIFKPTIDAATDAIFRLGNWFNKLTGNQQELIRNTVLVSGAILGGVVAFRVLGGLLVSTVEIGGKLRSMFTSSAAGSVISANAIQKQSANVAENTAATSLNTATIAQNAAIHGEQAAISAATAAANNRATIATATNTESIIVNTAATRTNAVAKTMLAESAIAQSAIIAETTYEQIRNTTVTKQNSSIQSINAKQRAFAATMADKEAKEFAANTASTAANTNAMSRNAIAQTEVARTIVRTGTTAATASSAIDKLTLATERNSVATGINAKTQRSRGGALAIGAGKAFVALAVADLVAEAVTPSGEQKDKYGNYLERAGGTLVSTLAFIRRNTLGQITDTKEERANSEEINRLREKDRWGVATDEQKRRLAELEGKANGKKDRSDLSLTGSGFGELGSGWERLQVELLKVGGDIGKPGGPDNEKVGSLVYLKQIAELLVNNWPIIQASMDKKPLQ